MKIHVLATTLATASLGARIFCGQWTLLHDFETGFEGWDITHNLNGFGRMVIQADPRDPGNRVFYLESGGYGIQDNNTNLAALTLPIPIDEGEMVALFWRYYETGPGNNFQISFTDAAKTQDEAGTWIAPVPYTTLETIYRVGSANFPSETSARSANRYARLGVGDTPETFVPFVHQSGTWYDMWMIVRNEVGTADDSYSLWVQGGQFQFPEPTVLRIEELDEDGGFLTGNYPTKIRFRNGVAAPLVTLTIFTESGYAMDPFAGDPWFIDDIYITQAFRLWHGYAVDAEGYADTGDWMGVVYVVDIKKDWAYAFTLHRWVNVGRTAANGGWVYIAR